MKRTEKQKERCTNTAHTIPADIKQNSCWREHETSSNLHKSAHLCIFFFYEHIMNIFMCLLEGETEENCQIEKENQKRENEEIRIQRKRYNRKTKNASKRRNGTNMCARYMYGVCVCVCVCVFIENYKTQKEKKEGKKRKREGGKGVQTLHTHK